MLKTKWLSDVFLLAHIYNALAILPHDLIKNQMYADDETLLSFMESNPTETSEGYKIVGGDIAVDPEVKSAVATVSKLWPLEIKYTLSAEVDGDAVRVGLNYLMNHTCLTFTEVDVNIPLEESHLRFISEVGSGCWSFLGKQTRHGQPVSISPNCRGMRTVVHEVMHALGFYHEISRADRDSYVIIMEENIQTGKFSNFNKKTNSNNYSVPYDYTSVMHYRCFAFSPNGLPTVLTRDIRYENIIGTLGPSHNDLQAINRAYECAAACSGECFNNGFLDKSCTCVCPRGTSGTQCEVITGRYYPEICLEEVNTTGVIRSPGYPNQEVGDCYYLITAPQGQIVRLTITDMEIKGRNKKGKCLKDQIYIRTESLYLDDETGCGTELQDQIFTSTATEMVVKYKSRSTKKRGFEARVEFL